MNTSFWQPCRFIPGDAWSWKLGPLELFVRRTRREWRIGYRHDPAESTNARLSPGQVVEFVPDLSWYRWPTSDEGSEIFMAPVMPDRPLVVRPDAPITLNPGRGVDFFVGVPAWVAVSETGTKGQHFVDVPSRPLSDTWFGELDAGALCYSSITSARRFLDEMDERPNRIVCKLEVRNDNDKPLVIERICLHTEFLEVFAGEHFLWAPEGRIIYKGLNQTSQIIFSKTPPDIDQAGPRIGGRQGSRKRGFLARGIASAGEVFQ